MSYLPHYGGFILDIFIWDQRKKYCLRKMAKIDPIYFTQLLSEAKKPKQGITKVIFGFECSFGYL